MPCAAPVRASVDITYACDLRCIHCRTNTGEIPVHIRRRMLSADQLQDVLRQLDDLGTFEITLTGGEPTMRKSFWDVIKVVPQLDHAIVTLITNAANLTPEQLDEIVAREINSLRVSVDGTRETFLKVRLLDVFDQVISNAAYLAKNVDSFKILTTAMTTNYDNIFELTDYLRSEGFRRQDIILVRAHGRGGRNRLLLTESQTMALYRRVREFQQDVSPAEFDLKLNAPYLVTEKELLYDDVVMYPYRVRDTSIAISATGDVTMSRLYSAAPLGNVKDRSLRDIWEQGQEQLQREQEQFPEDKLREIFWEFAPEEGNVTDYGFTSLLDRQIFEGYEVR
ncbi:radical SAM protein [Rathayibacter toxicus]|uniref:Radical SAM protein n=1 Tax=Rathayibacter toxicus TaxID=145458 RepID=A0A0C5BAB7_9MICO|nr:radical SAM protein [Rathayibacter toxicus]AJM77833.1 radical SAM protein [Rathayibacter toxicus]ALS57979.1 radical SAM protein [Rathayibacter toxicus]KKM44308.1 radical SAM protein [Rathayibacter toxicus]PPG20337.1 radical SAM protein [Rathayibacter toxicus]PPG45438.1 radical SAM protein [Rathayibacter toxicus]